MLHRYSQAQSQMSVGLCYLVQNTCISGKIYRRTPTPCCLSTMSFEILVVELVQLRDHVAVAEISVLIYSHNEQSGKCVDHQITHFKPCTMKLPLNLVIVFMASFQLEVTGYLVKVIRRLATKPVGVGALDFHQGFVI